MITKPSKHRWWSKWTNPSTTFKTSYNKYEAVRISPEAKAKLQKLCKENNMTMVAGINRLLQIDGAFTNKEIYQGQVDKVTEEQLAKTKQSVLQILNDNIPTKPPSAIIDASILYSFKQLAKKTLTRTEIKESVIKMMQESKYPNTWANVYFRWWENYQRNKSKFELDFDNRLRRLVKDKLISNYRTTSNLGEYSHNLSKKHWDYIEQLATGFYPQIVIDKILSIK